eukprot:20812_1
MLYCGSILHHNGYLPYCFGGHWLHHLCVLLVFHPIIMMMINSRRQSIIDMIDTIATYEYYTFLVFFFLVSSNLHCSMVLSPTLQYFSNQFIELAKNSDVPLTIANTHHIIESGTRCTCYLCNLISSIRLSNKDRHSMLQIIGSCDNFELDDPIEFLICALQSAHLNKLSKLKQFVNRNSIIYSQITSQLMDNARNSMPSILRTDILMHTIFNFVGGDYFISLCKYTDHDALQEEAMMVLFNDDTNLTLHNIHCIALIDAFGNIICRLSSYFRCPDWSFVYVDAHDTANPSVFIFLGDQIFRWELNQSQTMNDNLLSLDMRFQDRSAAALDQILGSRYWDNIDVSHGICVWDSSVYIVSEEYHHIANNASNEYLLNICILQFDTLTSCVINQFEFEMDHDNNDYDFLIASSQWLLSDTASSFCFVLFHRYNGVIHFIDPLNCNVTRKIKINQAIATDSKIIFVDAQIIGYSMTNQLVVVIVDLHGNVIQHADLPFGHAIQFVSLSDAHVYVDIALGDGNANRYLPVANFQQIISDDDTEELQETQNNGGDTLKWFRNGCWRYILDIRNLDILALFPIKRLRYSKLFYHVNPAKFTF